MAWLANLDARARAWPVVLRWPYRIVKALLIAIGLWCVFGLALEEWQAGKPALGIGVLAAAVLAAVKGVLMAVHRQK